MTGLWLLHAIVGALLGAVALQTVLNLRRVPRLERMPAPTAWPRIAVLVPARNEAARIADAVRAWAEQDYLDYEVIVYDDDSTDDTADRARAAVRGASHMRVIRGGRLPPGWRGKAHACHRLRQATGAPVLLFADADVTPAPGALTRTAAAFATLGVDALSALPSHRSPSLAVTAVVALQNWVPFAFAPLWVDSRVRRPLFVVMTGCFLAIRAEVYDAVGGFAAVRESLGEDVDLGRRVAAGDHAVGLLDGAGVLTCRPYMRLGELWRANVRNLAVAFFGSSAFLLVAMGALALAYLGPLVVLGLGVAGVGPSAPWAWAPLAELALALLPRAAVDRRVGYDPWLALLHPFAIAVLIGMAVESALRFRWLGGVEWRGRRYEMTDSGV